MVSFVPQTLPCKSYCLVATLKRFKYSTLFYSSLRTFKNLLAHKHKSQPVKNKNKHVYKHEVVLTSSDEVFFVALHRTCLFLIQYLFQGGSLLSLLCRLLREPIVFNLGLVGVDNGSGIFFSIWGYGHF